VTGQRRRRCGVWLCNDSLFLENGICPCRSGNWGSSQATAASPDVDRRRSPKSRQIARAIRNAAGIRHRERRVKQRLSDCRENDLARGRVRRGLSGTTNDLQDEKKSSKPALTPRGDSHIFPPRMTTGTDGQPPRPGVGLTYVECRDSLPSYGVEFATRSILRLQGCGRTASQPFDEDLATGTVSRLAQRVAFGSNRSRIRLASFAPLGHRLSGGLFFAPATRARHVFVPACGPSARAVRFRQSARRRRPWR
jgi:hypothetical protein